MRQAIFLDRDGVLNEVVLRGTTSHPPASPEEVEIVPGAAAACTKLRQAGFLLIIATNQPDVARGTQYRETVEEINRVVARSVPVDDVRICYHDDEDQCGCRKPAPGLLIAAARDWDVDLGRSFMVGDRWRDIEAGRNAQCKTVLVGDHAFREGPVAPDWRAASLAGATATLMNARTKDQGEVTRWTCYSS